MSELEQGREDTDRYSEELCGQKRDDIYYHVYTNYWNAGRSVYAAAAV